MRQAIGQLLSNEDFTDKYTVSGPDNGSRFTIRFAGTGTLGVTLARRALALRKVDGKFVPLYARVPGENDDPQSGAQHRYYLNPDESQYQGKLSATLRALKRYFNGRDLPGSKFTFDEETGLLRQGYLEAVQVTIDKFDRNAPPKFEVNAPFVRKHEAALGNKDAILAACKGLSPKRDAPTWCS